MRPPSGAAVHRPNNIAAHSAGLAPAILWARKHVGASAQSRGPVKLTPYSWSHHGNTLRCTACTSRLRTFPSRRVASRCVENNDIPLGTSNSFATARNDREGENLEK
ncbi:hypothetical protein V9T40_004633 [Parthenolecanium corni]|uniref:Uncharacterized protein n=1 Tax=Parthenolecanium corni TaxID=536013 RepID=A0AAN9TCN2_9HEMI